MEIKDLLTQIYI